jgi:ribonuclease HI
VGSVLINTDAALFANSRCMGVGVVIRDHVGRCLASCNEKLENVTAPELAEALACRRALNFARDEGFFKVALASDCLSLIQRIQSNEWDRLGVRVVVSDIKNLATSFIVCSFSHVKRQLNIPAHILARSCEHSVSMVYRGVIPECIQESLCNDSNV